MASTEIFRNVNIKRKLSDKEKKGDSGTKVYKISDHWKKSHSRKGKRMK